VLTRYLLREILSNFLTVLLVALLLLMLTRMADFGPEITARGGGPGDLLLFSVNLAVFLVPFALPLAALAGVLLSFMRLSHDQELLALSALGVSPGRLYRPVLFFALAVFLITLGLNLFLLPRAKRAMRDLLYSLATRRLERGLPEKTPVDWFPGLLLYAEKVKNGFHFRRFYLFEETRSGKKGVLYAEKGRLLVKGHEAELILERGEGHFFSPDLREVENFYFGEYRYRLPLRLSVERELKRGEMGLSELWTRGHRRVLPPRKRRKYLTEFYQRFFYPLAALVLPLLAPPLGTRLRTSGRGLALGAALFLYLAYYLLFSLATTLAESGYLPPPAALALPPVATGLAAFILYLRFRKGT